MAQQVAPERRALPVDVAHREIDFRKDRPPAADSPQQHLERYRTAGRSSSGTFRRKKFSFTELDEMRLHHLFQRERVTPEPVGRPVHPGQREPASGFAPRVDHDRLDVKPRLHPDQRLQDLVERVLHHQPFEKPVLVVAKGPEGEVPVRRVEVPQPSSRSLHSRHL